MVVTRADGARPGSRSLAVFRTAAMNAAGFGNRGTRALSRSRLVRAFEVLACVAVLAGITLVLCFLPGYVAAFLGIWLLSSIPVGIMIGYSARGEDKPPPSMPNDIDPDSR